ncbi:hypothetical protein IG631_14077 [Alternaria alternata]|nr:hypothetical protein IG631_14077 [Alternaria alternata]
MTTLSRQPKPNHLRRYPRRQWSRLSRPNRYRHTHLSATPLQPFIDYTQRKHRSKSTQIPADQSDLMQQLDSNDSCTGPAKELRNIMLHLRAVAATQGGSSAIMNATHVAPYTIRPHAAQSTVAKPLHHYHSPFRLVCPTACGTDPFVSRDASRCTKPQHIAYTLLLKTVGTLIDIKQSIAYSERLLSPVDAVP